MQKDRLETTEFLIVGAGIGGLCAALGLARAGAKVTVYEQAPALGEVGAGLTLGSNATRCLEWLGLGPYLAAHANVPGLGAVRHYKTGDILVNVRAQGSAKDLYGAEYYQIHRADLHAELCRVLRDEHKVPILLDHSVVDVGESADGGIWAGLESGGKLHGDILVGADGLRSKVRDALFDTTPATFTGQVAWRGMVPADRLDAARIMDPESCVYIGPGHIFTRYYLRGRELINYVCIGDKSDYRVESWIAEASIDELLNEECAGWHPDVREIIAATPGGMVGKWALFDRDPLTQWGRGHITLLGDAAHPMLPFLGQGAAMAIEDAVVFTRAMLEIDDPKDGLRRYEAARQPRTATILELSREQGRRYQQADPETYDARKHQLSLSAEMFGFKADEVAL